jgi:hypothetical protein
MKYNVIKLFFVLVCCFAIPLAAQAAHQDKNKKKKKQNQQQQVVQQGVGKQGKQQNASNPNKGKKGKKGNNWTNANNPNYYSNKGKKGKNWSNANNPNKSAGWQANKVKVKTKHYNLPNKPNPKIQSVKFEKNYHIKGSENWKGDRYTVFRNYNAEWHDRNWWHNHHNRIILIDGGWYAWNGGWWYPAWGYAPNAYYAYNGPIYAYNNLPPDQVIANVQAALQQQGYYHGDVDGLLGPLTRAAVADYQRDHGLYITSAIDQPTLESLGMT